MSRVIREVAISSAGILISATEISINQLIRRLENEIKGRKEISGVIRLVKEAEFYEADGRKSVFGIDVLEMLKSNGYTDITLTSVIEVLFNDSKSLFSILEFLSDQEEEAVELNRYFKPGTEAD